MELPLLDTLPERAVLPESTDAPKQNHLESVTQEDPARKMELPRPTTPVKQTDASESSESSSDLPPRPALFPRAHAAPPPPPQIAAPAPPSISEEQKLVANEHSNSTNNAEGARPAP